MDPTEQTFSLWQTAIAPQLGLSPQATITPADHGITSEVSFVSVPQGEFVVRWYPATDPSRLKSYLEAHEVLGNLGFHVPKLVSKGSTTQGTWLLEKRVAGKSFRELLEDSTHLQAAAETLARLHGHERRRYGKVGSWGGRRLSVRWRQRFQERWSKITGLFPELLTSGRDVEKWFHDWADAFTPKNYQLLHGDYHPGNLVLSGKGEVVLLDFRSPRYGFGLVEMIEAAHHFTGEEPRDWSPFVLPYLAARDQATRDLYDHFATSLHAVFHLRHADRFADLAVGRRGTFEDRRRWIRNALDSWQRFCVLAGVVTPVIRGEVETAFPSRTKG